MPAYRAREIDSTFQDPHVRGPAWVQFRFDESLSDLDTLRSHALTQAQVAHAQSVWDQPDHKQSKTLLKHKAIECQDLY